MAKSVSKKTTKTTSKSKKISISLDANLSQELDAYLEEFGYSKQEFIKTAIKEKISRDKISGMLDSIIQ